MAIKTTPLQDEAPQPAGVHHIGLNRPWDRYDENVQAAARKGKIHNAEPLIRSLNADMRVFSGLAVLIEIVRNNTMLHDQFEPNDPMTIQPLTDTATDALLSLASEVCNARTQDICGLADWVAKHIESREVK